MSNADIYWRFAEILNAREYDKFSEVMTDDFVDHHPGLVDVTDLETYTNNVKFVVESLQMVAEVEDVLEYGDKVFTRVKL
ncbi:MAG: nuclear transport factor 2 family protein, partial [Deinococcota bacterium]